MCTSIVPKAQRWPVSPWFCDNLHPMCQYVSMNNFIVYNTHLKAWYIHSVPHNLNLLILNYRLFRRPPSAPKITPLTKICFTWSRLHQKFAYLESKVPHFKILSYAGPSVIRLQAWKTRQLYCMPPPPPRSKQTTPKDHYWPAHCPLSLLKNTTSFWVGERESYTPHSPVARAKRYRLKSICSLTGSKCISVLKRETNKYD